MLAWLDLGSTRARRAAPALVAALGAALVVGTGAGDYLDRQLFFHPMMKVRAATGLQPRLDARIAIVLAEDRSLVKLGRAPTFADWLAISRVVRRSGVKTVLHLGIPDLRDDATDASDAVETGRLVVAAAVTDEDVNNRARDPREFPRRLLLEGAGSVAAFPTGKRLFAPAAHLLSVIDRVGALNLPSSYEVPLAYKLDGSVLLPSIALLGREVELRDDRLVAGGAPLPPRVVLDYAAADSVVARAVPVAAFFEADLRSVRGSLTPALAQRFQGAEVAIFVPDAATGSRVVDSPFGKVTAFHATVSLAHALLYGTPLTAPLPSSAVALLFLAALVAALQRSTGRRALRDAALLMLAGAVLAVAALTTLGVVLPFAQCAAIALAGIATRATLDAWFGMKARVAMAKDLELGSTVQRLLLPRSSAGVVGAWRYRVVHQPYGPMSGDWFQIFTDPDRGLALIAIGDVVGKGPSASLNTAVVAGIWNGLRRRWATETPDPAALLAEIDATVRGTFGGDQNTTIALVLLAGARATVTTCGALPWTHWRRGDAEAVPLRTRPANPLGILRNERTCYAFRDVEPAPGDVLVAFTDGVMDGNQAANAFRMKLAATPATAESDTTLLDAAAACSEGSLPDDATLVIVERLAVQDSSELAPKIRSAS